MCGDDGEPVTIDRRMWRRARKEHKCCACDELIRKGHRYHYTTALFEGSWETHKHCARCWKICEALWRQPDVYVIDFELNCGELWSDNFGPEPEDIAKLAFMTPDEMQTELIV